MLPWPDREAPCAICPERGNGGDARHCCLVGVSLARLMGETSITRIENPPWLMLPATGGLKRSPTRTRLQLLPVGELEWENFERLCCRLTNTDGDVEQWAQLYGERGQKQDGVDIYVRRPGINLTLVDNPNGTDIHNTAFLVRALLPVARRRFTRMDWRLSSVVRRSGFPCWKPGDRPNPSEDELCPYPASQG